MFLQTKLKMAMTRQFKSSITESKPGPGGPVSQDFYGSHTRLQVCFQNLPQHLQTGADSVTLCYHKPPEWNSTQARCAPECAGPVHFSVSTEEFGKYSSGAIWGKVSLCGPGEHALSAGKEKEGRKQFLFFFPPLNRLHTRKPSLSCH